MTEEVKELEGKTEPEVKTDPWEEKALSMGWNPDKFDKEDENYIDAKEFVRRKPLFDKIEQTTKRLKTVEQSLDTLASHHQRVKDVEFQRALKTLRDEKRVALKEGDTVRALEYEDQMEELAIARQEEVQQAQQQAALEAQRQQTGPSPEFQSWVKYNDWYLSDGDMHDFADGAAAAFIQRAKVKGTQLTEQEVFSHVLDKIRKAYPEKFENQNRQRATTVGNGDRGAKATKGSFKPTFEQQQVARSFVKQGIFESEQEYYKELQSIEESK